MRTAAWSVAAAVLWLGAGSALTVRGAEPAPAEVKDSAKAGEAAAGAPGLRFGAPVGVAQFYKWSSEQQFRTTTGGGAPSERRASVAIVFKVTPRSVDASGSVCEVSMLTYAFENDAGGGQKTSYDSQAPQIDGVQRPLDTHMRPMLNVPVTVRTDASGRVTAVEGTEMIPETPAKPKMVSEIYGMGGMQRKLGPVLGTRAEGVAAAAPGVKWASADDFELAPGAIAQTRAEHTIEKVEGSLASIALRSVGKMPPAPETSVGRMIFEDIITSGTQVWDLSKGMLERFESKQSSTVRRGEGPGAMAQAVELTQRIEKSTAPAPVAAAPAGPPAPAGGGAAPTGPK